MDKTRASLVAVAMSGAWLSIGCGHPATQQECEAIFEKSAELELRESNINDPKEIKARVEDAKAAKGAELTEGCVGKRITDDAMQCVREAESSAGLDTCLQRWW